MEKKQWSEKDLLKLSGGYWGAFTLHAGVKLDLFTLIGDDQLSHEDVANRLKGDVRGVRSLLNALTAMGLLIKKNGKYANTSSSKKHLVKGAPEYVGYMIMHHHHLVQPWSNF